MVADQKFSPSPGPSASILAAAVSPRQIRRPSSGSGLTSGRPTAVNTVITSSPNLSSNPYSALTTTQNYLDRRQTSPKVCTYGTSVSFRPTNPDHKYWCTVCDNHSFKLSDGWKKHEKEHEVKYVCMLKGLFESTKDGRKCSLCGALNQADSHHLAHNILPCIEAANRPSFKRRYDMVAHLKDVHAICDREKGGNIADKWRHKSSKNAWSCGFCVHLSGSLQDHLRHVGTVHFEKGQNIKDWDYSNVIRGLLLQPSINEAWIHLLESLGPSRSSETKWNRTGTESLLHRLQRGLTSKESPQLLAKAAYDSAEFDWGLSDKAIATSATKSSQYTTEGLSAPFEDHPRRSEEVPMEFQSWSSPAHQTSPIPRSLANFDALSTYGIAALGPSPYHGSPILGQGTGWDPSRSDSGDVGSVQPTTPFIDHQSYLNNPTIYPVWTGYNDTPGPDHTHQEKFCPNNDYRSDWPTYPQPNVDVQGLRSTLKRSRNSVSPPVQALPCKNSLHDRQIKKRYRGSPLGNDMEPRGFDDVDQQLPTDCEKDVRTEMGPNGYLKNDLYD